MKVVVIYGVEHKGSTYNIAQLFLREIDLGMEGNKVTEFFLPKDMPKFCCGCGNCFMKGEELCPHYEMIKPITDAMDEADLLIFDSPVYVYHTTGQMKTLLDHFGYRWMVHRPSKTMFSKVALVISTAAGAGMKSTNKDITDSLSFWGVGKIYTYGKAVAAVNWQGVSDKNKGTIESEIKKLSIKVAKSCNRVSPSLKVRLLFYAMRFAHKHYEINVIDRKYWKTQGWLGKNRPWHRKNEVSF